MEDIKKIRVLVDDTLEDLSRDARRPVEDYIRKSFGKILILDTEMLVKEMSSYYSIITDALSQLPRNNQNFNLDNVRFTLGIDSSGNVSLFSTLSGAASAHCGFTFTLSTSKEKSNEKDIKS